MSHATTPNGSRSTATIAVVGGGYGGILAAKSLDDVADVVLIEPQDSFVHNLSALRGVVDPSWADRIFLPYDRLLRHGRVLRGRAERVDSGGVTLSSGRRVAADYIVLATGSTYPYPAKFDDDDRASGVARLHATHAALAGSERVLLLGAGPVGLELAGEIASVWPDKTVTIVDPADDILSGRFSDAFRSEIRRQLDGVGVELLLGTALDEPPATAPGEAATFTATTRSGRAITADLWFRCFGVVPVSDYLDGDLAAARRPDGHVEVDPALRVPGTSTVFAIGDITSVPEPKTGKAAGDHARIVASNIRTLLDGGGALTEYEPGPDWIALPLGPKGGASFSWDFAPETGIVDAETTSQIKGVDLLVEMSEETLGLR